MLGGNLALQFTLASPYSRHGAWGLTDDVAHPDRNARFPAARDLIDKKSDRLGWNRALTTLKCLPIKYFRRIFSRKNNFKKFRPWTADVQGPLLNLA